MNYREMLTELINGSGMTLNAIVKELKTEGVEITSNYLSILKNSDNKIASDEVSRAIAKVCKAKYEDILVVQGYLDKAPETIYKMLECFANMSMKSAKQFTSMLPSEKALPILEKMEKEYQEHSMAYHLCEAVETMESFTLESMFADIEDMTKVSMSEKLKKVQSGEWLLVPVNTDKEVVKITSKEAQKIIESLALDNS